MRVGVLDRDLHEIARLHPRRHVAQEHLAVDLGRVGLAAAGGADMVANSPQVRFAENSIRGYSLVDVTPATNTLTMRAAADATDPDTATATLRTFVMENGVPGFA